MTPPTCSCGNPATFVANRGHVLRGTKWIRVETPLCDPCAEHDRQEQIAQFGAWIGKAWVA